MERAIESGYFTSQKKEKERLGNDERKKIINEENWERAKYGQRKIARLIN